MARREAQSKVAILAPGANLTNRPCFPRERTYQYGRLKREAIDALTEYQHKGIVRALTQRDHLLFWVVGSGKTLSALTWALAEDGKKVVYVTRASALLQTRAEIAKWTTAKVQLLRGTIPTRRAAKVKGIRKALVNGTVEIPEIEVFDPTADVYLIGYEVLWAWVCYFDEFLPMGFNLVFDELHRLKGYKRDAPKDTSAGWRVDGPSQKANLAWAAKRLSLRAARRLGVTGTPIRDRPRDLWAQLDLVDPSGWGTNWDFVHRYCDARENQWGGLDTSGASNETELRGRIDVLAHRVTKEELQLQIPPRRRSVVRIPAEDLLPFDQLPSDILKVANDPHLGKHISTQLGVVGARKAPAVVDLIASQFEDGAPSKVLVFTWLRADAERLAHAVDQRLHGRKGNSHSTAIWHGHGGHSQEMRNAIREQYMAHPGPCVLIGTGDAWGESLNLQDTDVQIFAALPFTVAQLQQWEGRAHRMGGTRSVTVIYTVGEGTADEHVSLLLLDKLPAIDRISAVENDTRMGEALRKSVGMDDEALTVKLMRMIVEGERVA